MPQGLDQDAVNLAKAIRQVESGGNFTARGKSGEYGAYQYTEPTWQKNAASAGVNVPLSQATPEQQNEVAYKTIKALKDQGYNPGQIASIWNSGKPDAYKDPAYTGTNKYGVSYDVPAYAKSVATAYHTIKNGGSAGIDPLNPSSIAAKPQETSFVQDVGQTLTKAGAGAGSALQRTLSGEINPLSGILQGAGSLAAGVGGLTSNVLEHTPIVGDVFKGVEGLIGKGVGAAAGTEAGQALIGNYQRWAQEHPELAGDVGAAFDIATAIPILKGVGVAKSAASSGLRTALKGGTDAVLETVSPRLTAKGAAEAIAKQGTTKKGLLREVTLNPNQYDVKIADAVKANVPKFNPNKSLLYNIDAVQTVTTKMKNDLKKAVIESGANRIYSFKELASKLKGIEPPLMIASDRTMQNAYDRVIAKALEIARAKGGKVSNLLDVRQDFDNFVKRQFPNLYKSDTLTPMRQAIGDIRDALNEFTASNLPAELGLRENLMTQHYLIKAIENMSSKAGLKSSGELGRNILSPLTDNKGMSGLVKAGGKALLQGTGIGATMGLMK